MSYRGLLTLDAGAVEPQGRDAVRAALDVEDALVVLLSGLRLGQVPGQQVDGPHDSGRDIDLGGGQDLRTLLEMSEIRIQKLRRDRGKKTVGLSRMQMWEDSVFWSRCWRDEIK